MIALQVIAIIIALARVPLRATTIPGSDVFGRQHTLENLELVNVERNKVHASIHLQHLHHAKRFGVGERVQTTPQRHYGAEEEEVSGGSDRRMDGARDE